MAMANADGVRRSPALEQLIRELDPGLFRRACWYHSAKAADFGPRDPNPLQLEDDFELWKVADNLSDAIVDLQNVAVADRVRLLFELYREMPSYWLIHKVDYLEEEMDGDGWSAVWAGFRAALSDESAEQADPASYALWSGLFEGDTSADAWRALATDNAPDRMMKRLLRISGPVPWMAKVETYRRLAQDARWQVDLAEALHSCYADTYGQNDARDALELYARLQVPRGTVAAANAARAIKDLKRGVAHFRDRGGSSHGA